MRATDSTVDPDVKRHVRARRVQSYGGTIVAVGGFLLAILRPELAIYGILSALIGAGLIDPSALLRLFVSK